MCYMLYNNYTVNKKQIVMLILFFVICVLLFLVRAVIMVSNACTLQVERIFTVVRGYKFLVGGRSTWSEILGVQYKCNYVSIFAQGQGSSFALQQRKTAVVKRLYFSYTVRKYKFPTGSQFDVVGNFKNTV